MLTEDEKREAKKEALKEVMEEIKEGMKRQDIFFYIWAAYISGVLILGGIICYMAYYYK